MSYKVNPRTGLLEPKANPEAEIEKAVIRKCPAPEESISATIKTIRNGLYILICGGTNYLVVELQGQPRVCGVIRDMQTIQRHASGPLVNFHRVWANGFQMKK